MARRLAAPLAEMFKLLLWEVVTDSAEQLEILSAELLESDALGVIVEPPGGGLSREAT